MLRSLLLITRRHFYKNNFTSQSKVTTKLHQINLVQVRVFLLPQKSIIYHYCIELDIYVCPYDM